MKTTNHDGQPEKACAEACDDKGVEEGCEPVHSVFTGATGRTTQSLSDAIVGQSRDRLIDGWRGVAVMCVVMAHALAYRFSPPPLVQRVAEPLAEMGVQLFFVISGYIITTLLLREDEREGRINISAFYARRFFRILPPLFGYYAALFLARAWGSVDFEAATIGNSALFTCNTGLTDCQWWVAHTWSLAVEEQFYLVWPLLLTVLPLRAKFLAAVIVCLLAAFLLLPFQWHSNWISFACIAAGALYATSEKLRRAIQTWASYPTFLAAGLMFVAIPAASLNLKATVITPLLVPFLLFSARELPLVRRIVEFGPIHAIGLCSYSLYLWQQLFLAKPGSYAGEPLPLALLPLAVLISYLLLEKPMAKIGHRVSARLKTPSSASMVAVDTG